MTFNSLFDTTNPERSQFMAAVFNLFSHDIVRCWTADAQSPYDDLGKATLRKAREPRGITPDFTFSRRKRVYAVGLRCDPVDDNTLTDVAQIDPLSSTRAFGLLLGAAKTPSQYKALLKSEKQDVTGSILIWGSVDKPAARAVKKRYNFHEILSLEDMIADLVRWQNHDFQMLLDRRVAWSHDLFKGLRRPT